MVTPIRLDITLNQVSFQINVRFCLLQIILLNIDMKKYFIDYVNLQINTLCLLFLQFDKMLLCSKAL